MVMKYLFITLSLFVSSNLLSQTSVSERVSTYKKEKPLVGFLGELKDTVFEYYPIQPDYAWEYFSNFAKKNSLVVLKYPLLIVNGMVIRNVDMLNSFRNNDSVQFKKTILMSQSEARRKLNIPNIPKDGVIIVFTTKKQLIDF